MPILAISDIPKFDGIVRLEVRPIEGLGMKKPITKDKHAFGRLRPELMHHHIIRMHAQKHIWENGIVKYAAMIIGFDVADRQCASVAAHGQTAALGDGHKPAEEGTFA